MSNVSEAHLVCIHRTQLRAVKCWTLRLHAPRTGLAVAALRPSETCCVGVPVHVAFPQRITAPLTRRALISVPTAASIALPDSMLMQMAPPKMLAAALARAAQTLTALHGLPLSELRYYSPDRASRVCVR